MAVVRIIDTDEYYVQRGTYSLTTARSVILDDFGVGYFGCIQFQPLASKVKTWMPVYAMAAIFGWTLYSRHAMRGCVDAACATRTVQYRTLLLLSARCCCSRPFSVSRTVLVRVLYSYLCGPPVVPVRYRTAVLSCCASPSSYEYE